MTDAASGPSLLLDSKPRSRREWFLVVVGALLGAIFGAFLTPAFSDAELVLPWQRPSGTFIAPEAGDTIARLTTFKAEVEHVRDKRLWLVVDTSVGDFPVSPTVVDDKRVEWTLKEIGAEADLGVRFTVYLVTTDASATSEFARVAAEVNLEAWGPGGGTDEQLLDLKGVSRLDTLVVTRHDSP